MSTPSNSASASSANRPAGFVHPIIGIADIARLLVDIAEREDADLLVVGRRGLGPIRSAVLGSVSDAAIRDGRRPVLVVPGPSEHD